jgi:hypothetical protein
MPVHRQGTDADAQSFALYQLANSSVASIDAPGSIVDRQLIAVHASARALARAYGSDVMDQPGYREALIEAAITTNAALGAHSMRAALGGRTLQGMTSVYEVYLLDARTIWTPQAGSNGLGDPPADLAGFRKFADALLGSERIASLLATG